MLDFEKYKNPIEEYCVYNNLSFEKLLNMVRCVGKEHISFVYRDKNNSESGLLDETPAKVVLVVRVIENELSIEETEYTKEFLQNWYGSKVD